MSTYRSPFERWNEQAAVRVMPSASGRWPVDAVGDWFLEERSWNLASHPAVIASGRRPQVLAALLLGYLDFTIRLESECIVPACRDLVLRRVGADYDAAVVRDALRVQCDEAFHALICEELAEHVIRATGLRRGAYPEHSFFQTVRAAGARTSAALSAPQYAFCVAVVSETVITDSLQSHWRGNGLRPEVRAVLLNHYKDEVRHSTFFSQASKLVWSQWPEQARDTLAHLWPELAHAFVRVDASVTAAALELAGFPAAEAQRIASEAMAAEGAATERQASFEATVRALRNAGVLTDKGEPQELNRLTSPGEVSR